jgi:hypothetical protein
VVAFAVTNVDYIIVLSVLFARRDLRFHSLLPRRPVVAGKRTTWPQTEARSTVQPASLSLRVRLSASPTRAGA